MKFPTCLLLLVSLSAVGKLLCRSHYQATTIVLYLCAHPSFPILPHMIQTAGNGLRNPNVRIRSDL